MTSMHPDTLAHWQLFTRLGEAQILLPAVALAWLSLALQAPGRTLALWWAAGLCGAVALTTVSKVAFIGWGIGWAALDFTGVSGHAMFAAAIYPPLGATLAPARPGWAGWCGVALGSALALMIGVSRVVVDAHSVSESVAGVALGGAVAALALWRAALQGPLQARVGPWLVPLTAFWLASTPAYAPPSQTHPMVTRLALALSGHEQPYTREQLRARL